MLRESRCSPEGSRRLLHTGPLATGQRLRVLHIWAPNHRSGIFGFAAVFLQMVGMVIAQPNPVPPLGDLLPLTEVPFPLTSPFTFRLGVEA